MSLILMAAAYARTKHAKQMRKWSDQPYITHPARVAGIISCHAFATEARVAAGWLHDVIEDTETTSIDLWDADFPKTTVSLVVELTNPSKERPDLNRADRKKMDREHLQSVSLWAKLIKSFDRLDNLRDMAGAEDGFKRLYVEESFALADALEKNCSASVNGLHLEIILRAEDIRKACAELLGHSVSMLWNQEHSILDGPSGARGL